MRFVAILVCVVVAAGTAAQTNPPADLEAVLLPVHTSPLAGQSGALWETELWAIANRPDVFVGPILNRDCPPVTCGPPPPPPPPAHEAFSPSVFRTRAGEPPGVLVYVSRAFAGEVTLALRVADVTRRRLSEGVTVPVVRERDFISGRPAHLLNVPLRETSRVRLRIYALARTSVAVTIRIYKANGGDVFLGEQAVLLQPPAEHPDFSWPLPLQPASAELDLAVGTMDVAEGDTLRIEVSPHDDSVRFWAFATITNNLTNDVTIVTP